VAPTPVGAFCNTMPKRPQRQGQEALERAKRQGQILGLSKARRDSIPTAKNSPGKSTHKRRRRRLPRRQLSTLKQKPHYARRTYGFSVPRKTGDQFHSTLQGLCQFEGLTVSLKQCSCTSMIRRAYFVPQSDTQARRPRFPARQPSTTPGSQVSG